MIQEIARNEIRLLTFRRPTGHLRDNATAYLGFGLLATWIVGIGRYWDNPRADLWQHLGFGSVIYVFVLAGLVYWLVKPLRPNNWSYKNVLLFITLTAPPAMLYAIPVERFMPLAQAAETNAWFLAVVAAWRVALYGWFLRALGGLGWASAMAALLLPLVLIVLALTALNLEHVVFRIMGGILEEEKSANDLAYGVVFIITYFAMWASPVILGIYGWCVYRAWSGAQQGAAGDV